MRLIFSGGVKIWEANTKGSSEVYSGTDFPTSALPRFMYVEGIAGSSSFRDVEISAQYVHDSKIVHTDTATLTVFEVTLAGIFSGPQQSDNDAKHSTRKNSSDMNGTISWDDADGDGQKGDLDHNCQYFSNCMEDQGTVHPPGSWLAPVVSFDLPREAWFRIWIWDPFQASWYTAPWNTSWTYDHFVPDDRDLTPSFQNHIYQIDGPGWYQKEGTQPSVFKGDVRDWAVVNLYGTNYQCSDYYKWHAQLWIKEKDGVPGIRTRDVPGRQLLGAGWIEVVEPGPP